MATVLLVSRLVFSRGGEEGTTSIGEHVWDPTHAEASTEGGSSSVLSPPVREGSVQLHESASWLYPIPAERRLVSTGTSGPQGERMKVKTGRMDRR